MIHQNYRNQQNSDDIARVTSVSSWWGSILTFVILSVAIRNFGVNVRTLHLTEENLENTKKNAGNTSEMISQLRSINEKLERMN